MKKNAFFLMIKKFKNPEKSKKIIKQKQKQKIKEWKNPKKSKKKINQNVSHKEKNSKMIKNNNKKNPNIFKHLEKSHKIMSIKRKKKKKNANKKFYPLRIPILGRHNSTRALQSIPFQNPGR